MKQKTKSIVTALLLGVLCAVTLSAVITVPDWETARADLLIGMQYETTGLDLDAVPGWLAALVMLHQNFPLDGWAWGLPPRGWPCCSAGCAASVRRNPSARSWC